MIRTLFLAATMTMSLAASATSMKDVGNPAALLITAEKAVVADKDGRTTLTLKKLAPVVTAVSSLGEKRRFETFALDQFAATWNSCNSMKEQQKWWHEDGFNTILQFERSPGKLKQNAHFKNSRLITTQVQNDETTMETSGGSAKVMLVNARGGRNQMTFDVTSGKLRPGSYSGTSLLAECIAVAVISQ